MHPDDEQGQTGPLSPLQGQALTRFARACIRHKLGGAPAERPGGSWGEHPIATFVTLRWPDGALQGCIGSLEPRRSLLEDVSHNAVAAALWDPRARPLTLPDVERLTVEVSVLSPLQPLQVRDELEARARLRPPVDGVVLSWQGRRATFLPQMWDQLPDPERFLAALKQKAGLPRDFWHPDLQLWRYSVQRFEDRPAGEPGSCGQNGLGRASSGALPSG
ncbi:MAG: AmmeMemoRadiSam system protein A [Myxococcales bacterium]|nr:AmmeMemoRadiSam system protein A [Myxococcota bacterium]MDW8283660.1 AmmeMemoRadiSam system protein A [Myxococcales bacterium]